MLTQMALEEAKSSGSKMATAPRKRKFAAGSIAVGGGIRQSMEDMAIDGNDANRKK
jgi:hypothetical protein